MAGMTGKSGKEREISRYSRYEAGGGKPPLGGISRLPSNLGPTRAAMYDLADRLRRLSPSVRDPERFHVEKSEIEHELRHLAQGVG